MKVGPRPKLKGALAPPGDKSIAHRVAFLAALARGTSEILRFAPGDDCRRTLDLLEATGVRIEREADRVRISGRGLFGLAKPADVLDAGNSGSTIRMSCGILAAQAFDSVVTGDDSLKHRPMGRVVQPLGTMGAAIECSAGGRAPLTIRGGRRLTGRSIELSQASAQVKTALLFAGLHASGTTRVREPLPSRDHTERLLLEVGAPLRRKDGWLELDSPAELDAFQARLPGDPSSAAFFIVAASLLPDSDLLLHEVGLNPTRIAFLEVLRNMGANVEVQEITESGGEPMGSLRVRATSLRGTTVPADWAPRLIDEVPILAVAAAFAEGETVFEGVSELRHKESDRLSALVSGLSALGASVSVEPKARAQGGDSRQPEGPETEALVIRGGKRLRGAALASRNDHRIAMAWTVAALALDEPCAVDDTRSVGVSYPQFFTDLERLAA